MTDEELIEHIKTLEQAEQYVRAVLNKNRGRETRAKIEIESRGIKKRQKLFKDSKGYEVKGLNKDKVSIKKPRRDEKDRIILDMVKLFGKDKKTIRDYIQRTVGLNKINIEKIDYCFKNFVD